MKNLWRDFNEKVRKEADFILYQSLQSILRKILDTTDETLSIVID